MLAPPTPSTKAKEKENNGSDDGGVLIEVADNGSEDRTSSPAEKGASTVPPAPSEEEAGTTPPAPTEKDAGTTPPASTVTEASMAPENLIDPKQVGSPKPHWAATPSSEDRRSNNDNRTKHEECVSCFLVEWLGFDPHCKRMLDDMTKMLAHLRRKTGKKAVPIFQQGVNKDPKLFEEARAQVTAALYAMCEATVRFNSRLGNIPYFTSGRGESMADAEGGRRKWVCKE